MTRKHKHNKHKKKSTRSGENGETSVEKIKKIKPKKEDRKRRLSKSDKDYGKSNGTKSELDGEDEVDGAQVVINGSKTHSVESISSASPDQPIKDVDSDCVDMTALEEDMNLDELMRQKVRLSLQQICFNSLQYFLA